MIRIFPEWLIFEGYHNIDKENWPTCYRLIGPALTVQTAVVVEVEDERLSRLVRRCASSALVVTSAVVVWLRVTRLALGRDLYQPTELSVARDNSAPLHPRTPRPSVPWIVPINRVAYRSTCSSTEKLIKTGNRERARSRIKIS